MDPDTLRQLGFFIVPNSQTGNPVDQTFNPTEGQSDPSSSLWDENTVAPDQGVSGSASTSTAPTSFSLDYLLQPSSPEEATNLPTRQTSSARSPMPGKRQILPTRPPRTRDGHERKRSKLSTDITPFDSMDYWMQFDNEDGLGDIAESMTAPSLEPKAKSRRPSEQRSINPRQTLRTTATTIPPLAAKVEDFADDSAVDNALSEDEENFSSINLAEQLSGIETVPPADVPQREGLYSTPLSWERPEPGLRMDQLIGLTPPSLNEAEQRRLIAIAMNPGPSMGGLGSNLMNFGLNSGFGMGTTTMSQVTNSAPVPKPPSASQPRPMPPSAPKKQNSVSEKGKGSNANPKSNDRAAHNDIERKYRTNLKDKIAELKSAVPALQTISEDAGDDDEPSQPGRAAKVSKGTVLVKATEYIHQLERQNKQIMTKHQQLSRRLQAFEQLLAAQARPAFRVPDYSRTLFDPRAFC